ncbi:primosomal replication protein [Aliivibrio fischeri]|uniref:primosomal replication protein n=1 Tax=Aliivibrio fischeri TaxID=668 RepID=UPI0012DA2837|nr:primosomal replication protein [Aliivibrio fischeri]MUL15985.1 prepilin peptidase [Aliivibrio fischeri]
MTNFTSIEIMLEQLGKTAAEIDRRRGEQRLPLFDERLFGCRSRYLVPCINEAKATLGSIQREEKTNILTTQRAEYLTQMLVAQIEAIQREVATQRIRSNEPRPKGSYKKPISDMYQDLAQHQEWERRLAQMVNDQELAINQCYSFSQQQDLQQKLLATEKRLQRCKEAMIRLEQQITYREQHD